MNKKTSFTACALCIASLLTIGTRMASSAGGTGQTPSLVRLQNSSPGTQQIGHANISGTMIAGQLQGDGGGITGLNAANMTLGTLDDARLSANIPRLNASNVYGGPINVFNGSVGINKANPGAALDIQGNVGGFGLNANNLLYVNATQGFVGVGRSTRFTGAELFGVQGNNPTYNGMYITGPSGSTPFYGYGSGSSTAWTEFTGNALNFVIAGNSRMTIGSNGNVGIGTTNLAAKLNIKGGDLILQNNSGSARVWISDDNGSDAGEIETMGPAFHTTNFVSTSAASPNYGYLGICDQTGGTAAWIYIDNQGFGNIVGDVKNFRAPNPRNPEQDFYYASVEGPEAAAYLRGTGHLVHGRAHIDLPQHYSDLTVSAGMTVMLTPKSPDSKGLGYWHGSNAGFDVFELNQGAGDYDFDWEIKCVRAGFENYRIVRDWKEGLPGNANVDKMWTARMEQIRQRSRVGLRHP